MPDGSMLVLGATGGRGGAVVDALLARAAAVRALVRDLRVGSAQRLADRGVEVVAGSLNDEGSLAAGMRAVAGVFAVTTPFEDGVSAEVQQGRAILAAAHRARMPHFDSKAAVESELIAAEVLLSPAGYGGQRIELASDAPTPAHMAQALGAALSHPVRHERTPLEAIGSADMRAMWEFLGRPRLSGRRAGSARCASGDFVDPV